MKGLCNNAAARWFAILLLGAAGCHGRDTVQIVNVSLSNSEEYQFPTGGGDEDGARITVQAKHDSVSEFRRSAAPDFGTRYVYRAAPGFVGSDDAEIELSTGSNGSTAPNKITRIVFHFAIHD